MTSKVTLSLDTKIYRAIKIKAVHTDQSLSELVNDALRFSLKEDAIDLEAFETRVSEPVRSYKAVLKGLKRDRLL